MPANLNTFNCKSRTVCERSSHNQPRQTQGEHAIFMIILNESPSDKSQWTLQWSQHHLYFCPFSVGGKNTKTERTDSLVRVFSDTFVMFLRWETKQRPSSTEHMNLEELVHVFGWCFIPHTRVGVSPHHVIDWLHNRQHLLKRRRQKQSEVSYLSLFTLCDKIKYMWMKLPLQTWTKQG